MAQQTNSQPVDVLAVMDGAAGAALTRAGKISGNAWVHQAQHDALVAARAAVVELIEAADEASVALGKSMQHTDELCSHMRLCAALARVQGGAA